MDSKPPNRRGFLKRSAALVGLPAIAVNQASAQTQTQPQSQTPAADLHHASPDSVVAYGERSRFVTSMRVPVAGTHSPDISA